MARVEKAATLARIEELLVLTGSGEKAGIISNAIQSLGSALVAWSAEPAPTSRTPDFNRRHQAMSQAVALVDATVTGIPVNLIDACDASLDEVRGKRADVEIDPSSQMQVFETCRVLMTALLDLGKRQDAEQDALLASISSIALPDEAELKKLVRYRSMSELSLGRRLAALEQVRNLTAGNVSEAVDAYGAASHLPRDSVKGAVLAAVREGLARRVYARRLSG